MPTKQSTKTRVDPTIIEGALASASLTSPTTPARVLYDADAQQIVPTIFDDDCEVDLCSAPLTDELIRAYISKRAELRAGAFEDTEIGVANVAAAFAFFRKFIKGIAEDAEAGAEWADNFGAQDRLTIISSLLACTAFEPLIVQKPKKIKKWSQRQSKPSHIRLRSFYNGDFTDTDLYFAKAAADVYGDYLRIVADESDELKTLDALAALYETMHVRNEGYAGRVPIHHKAISVRAHLDRAVQVTRKN